jgi:tetratricopeptide (TPR) repeat protein
MKRFASLFAILTLACRILAATEGPDDRFVTAYGLIQQGDSLLQQGQQSIALERFQSAETALKELQSNFPNWNEKVVTYRLNYVRQKIAPLLSLAKQPQARKPEEPAKPAAPTAPPIVTQNSARVAELEQALRQLSAEKDLVSAKLREALAAQPATLDPRELARAEEHIRTLEKENSLLKVSLEQAKETRAKLVDPATIEDTRKKLEETRRELDKHKDNAVSLAKDKQRLEREIATLRTETADLKVKADASGRARNQEDKLRKLESELAEQKGRAESAAREKTTLSKQVNELQAKLDDATRAARKAAEKSPSVPTATADASDVVLLRARLAVLEAQKVPFTPEELALLKPATPATTISASTSSKEPSKDSKTAKPPRKLPAGAGPLLSEAQASFAAKRYAEAEQKYKDVLRIDATNPNALSYLAATLIELKRSDEAEAHLRKALEEDPTHAFSLSMLGYLQLTQEKYPAALDTLSRAAQADAKNPNVQNNLGITLSKLGQRAAAETAFRKALQMLPDFEDAHFNLAVIYAKQQPPFPELARFHYGKAVSAGHAKDPALEKLLGAGK